MCRRLITIVFFSFYASVAQATVQVIELTQVPCQFLESEQGVNQGFKSTKSQDCELINTRTLEQRLAYASTLKLKPGKTIFRVTNKNVSYELGFWLRGATFASRVTLPSVSGGGLILGKTQNYVVDLKSGKYIFLPS